MFDLWQVLRDAGAEPVDGYDAPHIPSSLSDKAEWCGNVVFPNGKTYCVLAVPVEE